MIYSQQEFRGKFIVSNAYVGKEEKRQINNLNIHLSN